MSKEYYQVSDYTIQEPLLPGTPPEDRTPKTKTKAHPSPQPKLPSPPKNVQPPVRRYSGGVTSWIDKTSKD